MTSRFLVFNFYTDNKLYCDQLYNTSEYVAEEGFLFKRKECYNPLFMKDLNQQIVQSNAELVIMTTYGDNPSSYLHTDFLPRYFNQLPKKYILFAHEQYKNINMSIYIQPKYENYYDYISSYGDTLFTNINSIAITINSDLGKLVFIGIDINSKIDDKQLNVIYDDAINTYVDQTVNFYFIMSHNNNKYNIKNDNVNKFNGYRIVPENDIMQGYIKIFDIVKKNPKILCFSWNTDKTPLCDQNYQNDMSDHIRE